MENFYKKVDLAAAIHNVKECKLGNYASAIDYIPMGIGDSVFLSDVAYHQFFIDSEYIFVVAPQMKSIYMFDKDGKFIKSIGERGRAYG